MTEPTAEYPSRKLGLPDPLTGELDRGGWRVVNHTLSPEATGGLLLSLYCEPRQQVAIAVSGSPRRVMAQQTAAVDTIRP